MEEDLKRIPVLAELPEPEREQLAELLEAVPLRDGDEVFREGDAGEGLVLVVAGSLALCSRRAGDLGVAGPGTLLGGASLVAIGAREVTARAAGPTRLLRLNRAGYQRLLCDAPLAGARLLEATLKQLADGLRGELERFESR